MDCLVWLNLIHQPKKEEESGCVFVMPIQTLNYIETIWKTSCTISKCQFKVTILLFIFNIQILKRLISSPKFISFYKIALFSYRFWLSNQWWVLLMKNGVLDFKGDMMTMDTLINVYMEVTLKVRNSRTHVYLMWEKSLVVGFADVNNENKILTISLLYV